jgi:hypothetical protein
MNGNSMTPLHEVMKTAQLIQVENRIVTSRNWGEREMGSCHSAVEIFSPAR